MKKIESIKVLCESDYDNDLSFIGEYTDSIDDNVIVRHFGKFYQDLTTAEKEEIPSRGMEMRGFIPYSGGIKPGKKYFKQYGLKDYERMEKIDSGDIGFMSISAVASIATSDDGKSWLCNEISGGGLYGIESDSDESYLQEIAAEQVAELKETLLTLGFTSDEFDAVEIEYPSGLIFNLEPKEV